MTAPVTDHRLAVKRADDNVREAIAGLRAAVAAARAEGVSWHVIGQTLGVSRQSAHQRFAAADNLPRTCCGEDLVYRGQRCPTCLEVVA